MGDEVPKTEQQKAGRGQGRQSTVDSRVVADLGPRAAEWLGADGVIATTNQETKRSRAVQSETRVPLFMVMG